jgi:hypothetical protein
MMNQMVATTRASRATWQPQLSPCARGGSTGTGTVHRTVHRTQLGARMYYSFCASTLSSEAGFEGQMEKLCRELGERGKVIV